MSSNTMNEIETDEFPKFCFIRKNRLGIIFISLFMFIFLIGLIPVLWTLFSPMKKDHETWRAEQNVIKETSARFAMPTLERQPMGISVVEPVYHRNQIAQDVNYSPSADYSCSGSDIVCTSMTTANPAETLKKLIASIPNGKAKQYRIRLSVVPIDDAEDSNNIRP